MVRAPARQAIARVKHTSPKGERTESYGGGEAEETVELEVERAMEEEGVGLGGLASFLRSLVQAIQTSKMRLMSFSVKG